MAKKIYLGVSNFEKIIQNDGLFADKTLFIKEIIEDAHDAILITRPRRWGKTLNMSILSRFLSNAYDASGSRELFTNLDIAKADEGKYVNKFMSKYPVIFLSFKDVKEETFAGVLRNLGLLIKRIYGQHECLLKSTELSETNIATFKQYLLGTSDSQSISQSIFILSELLFKHYKQRVYILIDEYDTPLNEAYVHGYINELTGLMRNLFSSALKDNEALEKGVMTGILRISKDSMLSGLNNLEVYTILDKKYREYFGFTDSELDYLFREQGLERNEAEVKHWYNGYNFGGVTIYNPWSILSCLDKKGEIEPYWINTSNNKLIQKLLLTFKHDVNSQVISLMETQELNVKVNKHVSFDIMLQNSTSFWGLLLYSGYLTYDKCVLLPETGYYDCNVRIPNKEIFTLYNLYYEEWFNKELGINTDFLLKNLVTGKINEFTEQLNTFLVESASIRDTGSLAENFYHGLVLGLIASLRATHKIQSNRESGNGFPDVLIIPLEKSGLDLGLVLEFKHARNEEELDTLAESALTQINTKHYETELKTYPYIKRILKVGLAFNQKQVKSVFVEIN